MKVNVAQPIIGYDGDPFQMINPDSTQEVLAIRWAVRTALNTPLADQPWTPETMLECARLSKLAHGADEIDLDEKERTFIQERSAKVHATVQFGPMIHAELVRVLSDTPALKAVEDPGA